MKKVFNFRLLVLIGVLIMSVSQMLAEYNYSWYGNVFFRAPDDWDIENYSTIQIGLARTTDTNTSTYIWYFSKMDRVGTTRLFYKYVGSNHSTWNQNEYVFFSANDHEYGEGDFKVNGNVYYTTPVNYGFSNDNNPYLFNPNSDNNGASVTGSNCSTGTNYGDRVNNLLNKAQTVYLYSEGNLSTAGGSVNIAGTYQNYGNDAQLSGNLTNSTTNVEYNCAIGSTVTLTATPNTASGYSFKGWYTAATGGDLLSSNTSYSYTCKDTKNVYARFEKKYNVTVNAETGGTTTPSSGSNVNIGYYTSANISATANDGYRFTNWSKNSNSITFGSATNSASNSITTTGAGAVTANFASRFALIGSEDADRDPAGDANGMPGWGVYTYTLDYVAANDFELTLPLKGNRTYKFQLWDLARGVRVGWQYSSTITVNSTGDCWVGYDNGNDIKFTLNGSDAVTFKAKGFDGNRVNLNVLTSDQATTAHTVDFYEKTFFVNNTTETGGETGGTIEAKDWKNYDLDPGNKAKSGKAVVFTAAPVAGYTFAGWYSDAACTSPYIHNGSSVIINDAAKTLTLTIDGNKTVYAKFTENSTEVYLAKRGTGKIEVETSTGVWTEAKDLTPTANTINVGVHTTYNIRATAGNGNYFAKWDKVAVTYDFQIDDDEEEDYGEDNPSGVLKGKGAGLGTQMLYANFYELDKVYFRNVNASTGNKLWTNVYVYFDVTWVDDCAKSKDTDDAYYIGEMTEISDTKVYKAYVPRAFTRKVGDNHDGNIAFSNYNFGKNYKFLNQEGLKWASYTKSLDMCVPTQSDTETKNGTKYYKSYWKKSYDYEGFLGGYTLKQYSGSGYSSVPNSNFKIVDINTIQTTFYIKNATKDYAFMIESAGGLRYITQDSPGDVDGKDVYANACSNVTMTEWNSGSPRFTVHPNMEGEYTLTIDQSGEKMKLTVEYPVSIGDYRIKHTYNSGAKTTYSNAVKAAKVADTDTVSLFLSNVGTPVTVLQKCTLINASTKLPEWEDLNSTNLSGFNGNEPGVYKIGITITDNAVSNIPEVEAYTGDYYIHVNAKTKNYLTTDGYARSGNSVGTKFTKFVKNSKLGDTYDYYWVDWFQKVTDAGDADPVTEAQSVVATIGNDYSNDLAGELGDDEYSDEGKTLSAGANVRYGYDSKSNTFTRAMITGAGTSIMIANSQGSGYVQIYNSSNSTWEDAYSAARSSKDADNWIYTFNAKVREGSTATTTSSYNGQSMTLADGQKLLGGTGSNVYEVDVMYDFKTNRLISAWVPNPATEYKEPISLESNLMVVRREAGSPTLLNLVVDDKDASKEGGLLKVKQVYTVMEFSKENWDNSAWTVTAGGYKDAYFWISLPYDCYVSDIFGIPNYGSEDGSYWVLQTYRGDLRAEKGWWAETESWWYDMDRDDIMKANQGYVIRLTNLDDLGKPFQYSGDINTLRLYFPSANPDELTVGILKSDTVINFPEIKCTIVRDSTNHAGDPNYDRRAIDSNWRIIGSPCFNSAKISTTGWGETYPTSPDVKGNLQFFYTWSLDGEGKPKYTIQNASAVSAFEFKATHAYFVQYAGNITWTNYSTTPFVGFKAPARAQEENTDQTLRLVLNKNGEQADVTYIKRMEEGATEGYDLNKDLSKVMNGRMANLYTIAGYYKMGGNCLPDTTSIVPVGVRTAVAGDYTFSMPEGTNGTGVYLIDNVAGTRTNLALGDYTVTLAKGTFDDRFSLELSPIAQTPTDIEQTGADVMDGVRKVMVDGILYIVKDGRIYDATGNRVQ